MERAVPDLLLLDMKLPGIWRLGVLKEMSERRDETLAVMISAYATLETAFPAGPASQRASGERKTPIVVSVGQARAAVIATLRRVVLTVGTRAMRL